MYLRPSTVEEAVAALAASGAKILAGGTDFYPALGDRPLKVPVLDITAIAELTGIRSASSLLRIGARTSWTDIAKADLPPAFDGLKAAAREVGSIQIQNAGTIGGNLCNASPAADGVPPLLTLDASVVAFLRQHGDFIRRLQNEQAQVTLLVEISRQSLTGFTISPQFARILSDLGIGMELDFVTD